MRMGKSKSSAAMKKAETWCTAPPEYEDQEEIYSGLYILGYENERAEKPAPEK
jgi:hypothetical protein